MFQTIDLKKEYKIEKGRPIEALRGITLDLPKRGMVFILGKSGSGKTTLLNILAGLDRPSSGKVIFRDQALSSLSATQLDYYRNTYCGFIFQEYNVFPELTVGENISLALEMEGEKDTALPLREALSQVGLEGYEKRRIDELSGGQKQRVAIARALIKKSDVIFADEPTGALDSETGKSILELLKKISAEKLVLVVTHDRDAAEKFGDRWVELSDGEVIYDSGNIEKEEERAEDKSIVRLKKTKLPLKVAAKIGISNFRSHPIRLAVTLLLAVIAFTLFCVPLDMVFWDEKAAVVDAVYDNGIEYSALGKYRVFETTNVKDFSLDRFFGGGKDLSYEWREFTEEDMAVLQKEAGSPLVRVRGEGNFFLQAQFRNFKDPQLYKEFLNLYETAEEHYENYTRGFLHMDADALEYFGYKIEAGRLPQQENEVAIPKCLYNTFQFFGLIESDGTEYDISAVKDIVGHNLDINGTSTVKNYAKIVGVIDTGCSRLCAQKHPGNDTEYSSDGFHEKLFVSGSFPKLYEQSATVVYATPEEKEDFRALTNIIFSSTGEVSYYIFNAATSVYGAVDGGVVTMLGTLFLYIGIIFFLIAFFFLINFIKISLRRQMKQIGILSAMGIDTKGLLKIYGLVTMLICMSTFILSLTALVFVGSRLNGVFSDWIGIAVSVCQFHIVVPIVLFAALFIIALLSCVIPIVQYKQKSPAEIINKGLIK